MTDERNPVRWRDAPDPTLPPELVAAFARYAESGPSAPVTAEIAAHLPGGGRAPSERLRVAGGVVASGLVVMALLYGYGLALRHAPSHAGAGAQRPAPHGAEPVVPSPAANEAAAPAPRVEPAADAPTRDEARPARRRAVRAPAPPALPAPEAPNAAAAAPVDELALLVPARKLLAVQPARALTLLQQHEGRHPRGAFVEEREVLVVGALLRLGRTAEAHDRAQAFFRAHPQSPHVPALAQELGEP